MNQEIEYTRLKIKRLRIEISTLEWQLAVEQNRLEELLHPRQSSHVPR